jgi:hypothetical protein
VRPPLRFVKGPRVPGFHDPDKELRREFMEPDLAARFEAALSSPSKKTHPGAGPRLTA